jgi:hypothetical protein
MCKHFHQYAQIASPVRYINFFEHISLNVSKISNGSETTKYKKIYSSLQQKYKLTIVKFQWTDVDKLNSYLPDYLYYECL